MIIRTCKRKDPFARIDKRMLEDPRLSWKAKGILAYLMGRPNDWEVQVQDLTKRSTGGRDSIYSALKELRAAGYAKLKTIRSKGQFVSREWIIRDTPLPGFPDLGRPDQGKPDYTKNKLTKNKCLHSDARAARSGADAGFILPLNAEEDPFLTSCVAQLETYVRKKRRIHTDFKRARWMDAFRQLLKDIGGQKGRLKRVLKTYITEDHGNFTPQADSAWTFRKKFFQIERWAKEHFDGEVVDSVEHETLANGRVSSRIRYNTEEL